MERRRRRRRRHKVEYGGRSCPGTRNKKSLGPLLDNEKKKRNGRQREGQPSGGTELINGERSDEGKEDTKSRRSSGPRADLRICSAEAEMRSGESCNPPIPPPAPTPTHNTSSRPHDETAKDLQTRLVIHAGPDKHSPTSR